MNIWAVIGLILSCAIGVWKLVGRLKSQARKRAEAAQQMFEKGTKDADPSSITASLDRLNR